MSKSLRKLWTLRKVARLHSKFKRVRSKVKNAIAERLRRVEIQSNQRVAKFQKDHTQGDKDNKLVTPRALHTMLLSPMSHEKASLEGVISLLRGQARPLKLLLTLKSNRLKTKPKRQ